MSVYTFVTTIPEDRRLLLPKDIPPGRAEIRITFQTEHESNTDSLRKFPDELARAPRPKRTKEDIDQELKQERDSWE